MATVLDQQESRLDEAQQGIMQQMIETLEIDPREAKLRTMCIAVPPDHFKYIPPRGERFPRTAYHPDGRIKSARTLDIYQKLLAEGWEDHPSQIHVDLASQPDIKALRKLERDLQSQLKAVQDRQEDAGIRPELESPARRVVRAK